MCRTATRTPWRKLGRAGSAREAKQLDTVGKADFIERMLYGKQAEPGRHSMVLLVGIFHIKDMARVKVLRSKHAEADEVGKEHSRRTRQNLTDHWVCLGLPPCNEAKSWKS